MSIIWEEPPQEANVPRGRRSTVFTPELLGALQAHPGKFARIADDASNGSLPAWRKRYPELEFRAAPTKDSTPEKRRYTIWARWVGKQS